jgi:TRAP transporter TAXI family solute receptor
MNALRKRRRISELSLRELAVVGLPALLLMAAGFWLASKFVKPAPPDRIVITTGAQSGAYWNFAKRYADILARDGVTLEVRSSDGAVENLARLSDPAGEVELGFVQGGMQPAPRTKTTGGNDDAPLLLKLAAVAYEPLWVFSRGAMEYPRLAQLKGLRIAIGPEGSGTRALALQLIEANGLASPRLLALGGEPAANALRTGKADAMFLIAAAEAPVVQSLLRDPSIKLMSFANAEAYARRFPFLSVLKLPQSSIDFVADLPARDVTLVSTTANLLARESVHPALLYLMLKAMSEVHRGPGVFHRAGEFPVPLEGDFEISPEAQRYFKTGPPFLQRYLPFWAATFAERVWVMLLPVIAILLPLMKVVPAAYSWRVRSRFFRRYRELRWLEEELDGARERSEVENIRERIEKLDAEVKQLRVPLAYSELLYNFRVHIEMVHAKIESRLGRETSPAGKIAA